MKLVTEAVERYGRQRYAFGANLYKMGLVKSISAERDYKKKLELEEALRVLTEEPVQGKML